MPEKPLKSTKQKAPSENKKGPAAKKSKKSKKVTVIKDSDDDEDFQVPPLLIKRGQGSLDLDGNVGAIFDSEGKEIAENTEQYKQLVSYNLFELDFTHKLLWIYEKGASRCKEGQAALEQ